MAAEGLDLEFAVTLPPGISEEELARRLKSQAARLNELLAQPVLDARVGRDAYYSDPPGSSPPGPLDHGGWQSQGPQGPPNFVDRFSPGRGRTRVPQAYPATSPIGPGFLRDGSYWQQRNGSRICERKAADEAERREKEETQSSHPPFRAIPVPHSVTAPLYSGIQAYARLQRSQSAEGTGQRRGRAADAGSEMQGLYQREPRASSEERRPTAHAKRELRDSSEERQRPKRAQPVPWCVSAPLYDQMLIEDHRGRQERVHARSRALMRASSLPPRLEAVRKRLCGDEGDPYAEGGACGYRSSTPVPGHLLARGSPPKSRLLNRPLQAEIPKGLPHNSQNRAAAFAGAAAVMDAAENLSRDVAAGQSRVGWGVSSLHGSSYGISHVIRHKTPPRMRAQSAERTPSRPFSTTEVPDFTALHEKQRRERMKYSNRTATQPEPFVLSAPGRSLRARPPPLLKDPSKDPRFHRRPRSAARRSHSTPAAAAIFAAGAEGGSPSVKALERPSVTGPPRTTAKTLQAQQHTMNRLHERRAKKQAESQHIENTRKVDPEIRARVRAAVGPVESIDEVVERQTMEKRQNQRNTLKDKHRDLKDIHHRVSRRPLLMQQTDSVARARRLALFQFRGFLKDAGVANPDAHFQDDELDELDRVRSDAAAAGGM